jgi:hypothetical protein
MNDEGLAGRSKPLTPFVYPDFTQEVVRRADPITAGEDQDRAGHRVRARTRLFRRPPCRPIRMPRHVGRGRTCASSPGRPTAFRLVTGVRLGARSRRCSTPATPRSCPTAAVLGAKCSRQVWLSACGRQYDLGPTVNAFGAARVGAAGWEKRLQPASTPPSLLSR